MQCPKCNFEQAEGKSECLCCGLIFAKYRPPAYAQAHAHQAYPIDPTVIQPQPSAQRSYEFELARIGSRVLSINNTFVSLKDKSLACSDIQWLKIGSFTLYVNLIKTGTSYEVVFGGNQDKIKVDLFDPLYGKRNGRLFNDVVDAAWECVGARIVNDIIRYIGTGRTYQIGQSVWERGGVRLPRSRFFGATDYMLIPWRDLEAGFGNGTIWLKSATDRKAKMSAELRRVENACLISSLYRQLVTEGNHRLL
jgi:hypothetical protein